MTETISKSNGLEERILILMPTGRDGFLVRSRLEEAGFQADICADISVLEASIMQGAGAVLVAEEVFNDGAMQSFNESLSRQPVWSDIPVILFAANDRNTETLLERVGKYFNATIVERPIRIMMLISAVRAALRARRRQYQTRDLLEELKVADQQKDLFLATLSHELRTPLNSIVGWIPLLRGRLDDSQHLARGLSVIERNAKLQAELIADILFISRVVTGKLEINKQLVELVSIVTSAIEDLQPALRSKEVTLSFDAANRPINVLADPERLKQIFSNLLTNAIKFSEPGSRIDVSIRLAETSVEVEISDTGRGIDPDVLPFIFERFRQADGSNTRGSGGLGLGLAIVRHLADLHDGEITAESDGPGRGSTFRLSLPTITGTDDQPALSINSAKTDSGLENLKLLLIDDDADSRDMLGMYLQFYGVKVTAVDSAAAAMRAIENEMPDILISDVGMPDESGYDLIRNVRARPIEKGGLIPAIAVTGYVSKQDRALALEAGYQDHLAKPVDLDEIIKLIARLARSGQ